MERPVVADLGSGGGVLSTPLRHMAEMVYCVDNAPGMVDDVESSGSVKAWAGEVTDSNLSEGSIDLVICARVIEYLFWPDRLADEIKRIGKVGATFFVTFPAAGYARRSRLETPPDRVRHYFTPGEIETWATEIGPGRLIGIQYDRSEPNTPEMEQTYREIEDRPPPDANPTNWVYVGTIENRLIQNRQTRTIPLEAYNFRFASRRYDLLRAYIRRAVRRLTPKRVRTLAKAVLYRR
jgi:SAM-dependent methyltransferase